PYSENFNFPLTQGYNYAQPGWWYSASDGATAPGVSTGVLANNLCKWTADCSPALAFAGAINYAYSYDLGTYGNSFLPANADVYVVTPELSFAEDKSMKDVQVSFWSKRSSWDYSSRLIVGIMTDRREISTFVPMDTVELKGMGEMEEFIITFEKYEGEGTYIAFRSNFPDKNFFMLDDLEIVYTPPCQKPTEVEVSIPSASDITVSWNGHGKTSAEVVVSQDSVATDELKPEEAFIYEKDATGETATISGLTPWETYYVYVRVKDASVPCESEWSNPMEIQMPARIALEELPDTFDFEYSAAVESDYYTYSMQGSYSISTYRLPVGIMVANPHYGNLGIKSQGEDSYNEFTSPYILYCCGSGSELGTVQTDQYVYAIFPELPAPSAGKSLRAVFWHYKTDCTFGMVSDANNPEGSFTELRTLTSSDKWVREVLPIGGLEKGVFFAIRIGKKAGTTGMQYLYLDNLSFEEVSDCAEPDGFSAEPDEFSATIKWNANGVEKWELTVADHEVPYDSLSSTTYPYFHKKYTVEGAPEQLVDNLQPNGMVYYYYVRSVCGDFYGAWVTAGSFSTLCSEQTPVPYYLDFDEYKAATDRNFPVPCITTDMSNVSGGWLPNINTTYVFPVEGYNYQKGEASLKLASMYMESASNYRSYIILPKFAVPIDSLVVSFQMKAMQSESPELLIGVVTDPDDPNLSTFELVTTAKSRSIDLNKWPVQSPWEEHIRPLSAYKGDGGYICILSDLPHYTQYTGESLYDDFEEFYIDSLIITKNNGCLQVEDIEADTIRPTYASIRWMDNSADSYDVIISTTILNELAREEALTAGPTEGIPVAETITLTSGAERRFRTDKLTTNTQYYVYIRTNCGGSGVGVWPYEPGVFRTACDPMAPEVIGVENFDEYGNGEGSYPSCWTVGNGQREVAAYVPFCSGAYSRSGNTSLQLASAEGSNQAYAISPEFDIEDIRGYEVTFWGQVPPDYCKDGYARQLTVGVASDPSDISKFVPIATVTGYPEEMPYTVRFDEYEDVVYEENGKYVMFYSSFTDANYFYIDDVQVTPIDECPSPTAIEGDISYDNIVLSWRAGTAPYTIKYSTRQLTEEELAGTSVPDDVDIVTIPGVNATRYTVNDLDGATDYYFYIASTCGDGLSRWSTVVRMKTDCAPVVSLPFSENFDGTSIIGEYCHPDCWINYHHRTSQEDRYPHIINGGRTGNALYMYAYNIYPSYAVTPELDVESLSSCQVTFFARTAANGLIVGVVEDVTDGAAIDSTFVPVDTIDGSPASYTRYCIKFDQYTGNSKRVAFKSYGIGYSTGGWYVDDVYIEEVPTCPKPDYLAVKDISDSRIEISFEELGEAAQWEVVYGTSGFKPEKKEPQTVTEKSFAAEGLEPQTDYDFYVRSICGEGSVSNWGGPLTVTTTAAPIDSYPYGAEQGGDFSNRDENARWAFKNGVQENKWVIGDAIGNDGALYVSLDNGLTASYRDATATYIWAYRTIRLSAGEYTVDYDWLIDPAARNNTVDCMRVGILPVSVTFTDASNMVTMANGTAYSITRTQQPPEWIQIEGRDNDGNHIQGLTMYQRDKEQYPDNAWVHTSDYFSITPEQEGTYNLVVLLGMDNGYSDAITSPSAAIDNLEIGFSSCTRPVDVVAGELTSESAEITWTAQPGAVSYDVQFVTLGDGQTEPSPDVNVAGSGNFTEPRGVINDLTAWATYYVYVRTVCESGTSDWSSPLEVKLPCEGMSIGTTFGFEESEGWYTTEEGLTLPQCFEAGNVDGSMDRAPRIQSNNDLSGTVYARTGKSVICIGSDGSDWNWKFGGYLVFPMVGADESMDDMQISFWMRPFYHSESVAGNVPKPSSLWDSHGRSVTVGTMTDPYKPETFVPIKVCRYPYDVIGDVLSDDKNGYDYWVRMTVSLAGASGRYVAILNDGNSYGKMRNQMFIDDVAIEPLELCPVPQDVKISENGATSVKVSFAHEGVLSGDDLWEVLVSTDEAMADTALLDTLSSTEGVIDGLQPGTNYWLTVEKICSEWEKSGRSNITSFYTDYALSFDEEFSENKTKPDNWYRGVFCTPEALYAGTDFPMEVDDENYWHRTSANAFGGSPHYVVSYTGNPMLSDIHWIFTPVINIGDKTDVHLVFDLAVTQTGSAQPLDESKRGNTGLAVYVVVSDDGGETWREENTTVWRNVGGDYLFDSIPSGNGRQYRIPLDNIKGNRLKIGFLGTDENEPADKQALDLHLDNVHLNWYREEDDAVSRCWLEDYYSDIFTVTSDNLEVGTNEFSDLVLMREEIPDTVYNLTINVSAPIEAADEATICEGRAYDGFGFSGLTVADSYKAKTVSTGGCDSVFTLTLNVIPAIRDTVHDTICAGGELVWNGTTYTEAGFFDFTTDAASTDCDSIVTLALFVNDPITVDTTIYLCDGETYVFDGQSYTNDGSFEVVERTATLGTVEGCDSVVNLTLTVGEPVEDGIDGVRVHSLILSPNPIEPGGRVEVMLDLGFNDMKEIRVQVFSSTGAVLQDYTPGYGKLFISGLYTSGVYMVRITDAKGNVYQGKIVVR
ncbi:MAG: T9SS type A sorting domain-containing protein, partial [bacterium]|nr:T9SS type A sorting domain-containing protein [Candidatus Aphodosoma intestinipullorum]